MRRKRPFKNAHKPVQRYRVTRGKSFRLAEYDPDDTAMLADQDKPRAQAMLEEGIATLIRLQDMLYAQNRWALLAIFQAMDAAGKDSAIKHVMSGINPAGCQVVSFKAPSPEEQDHDYLWSCQRLLPERGRIASFNRSYYEEVLIVRVRPEQLEKEQLAPGLIEGDVWKRRYQDIRAFERHLSRTGPRVVKFFLYISREEQKRRFLARLEDPAKR